MAARVSGMDDTGKEMTSLEDPLWVGEWAVSGWQINDVNGEKNDRLTLSGRQLTNIHKEIPAMEEPSTPSSSFFPQDGRRTKGHKCPRVHRHNHTCPCKCGLWEDSVPLCRTRTRGWQRAVLGPCLCSPFFSFSSEMKQVSATLLLCNHCCLERRGGE